MKKLIVYLLFLNSTIMLYGQQVRVITWNIRFDNKADSLDQWDNRKVDLVKIVKSSKPDFFGIQEGLHHQVEYIGHQLKSYKWIGVGRDDGVKGGEYTALYYNARKWKPVKTSQFWLSETPHLVSRGWDAACHRVTTFGIFTNSKKDTIVVYNTHFDHLGEIARKNSVTQVNGLIRESKFPKILIGDFNFNPSSPLYNDITSTWTDSRIVANKTVIAPEGTFNGFKINEIPKNRIDYIFTDKNWKVNKYMSKTQWTKSKRHVSDHNMVIADLVLAKNN